MEIEEQDKKSNQEKRKQVLLTPAIKERLKIIASIIVERIIEDQQNGILRFKRKAVI